jgi:hypothetical protein
VAELGITLHPYDRLGPVVPVDERCQVAGRLV